jgi:hypothetical protein
MAKRLEPMAYLILITVNTVLSVLAAFSIGIYYKSVEDVDKMFKMRLHSLNVNKTHILNQMKENCSNVIQIYPQLQNYEKIDFCELYNLSMKLGIGVVMLSTLYDAFLPYALYGFPTLPIMIMSFTSMVIFLINFTMDNMHIQLSESCMLIAGYVMIFAQCAFPDFDDKITVLWLKCIARCSKKPMRFYV